MPHVPRWTIADLLDFEYLLSSERQVDSAEDEALFRKEIAPHLKKGAALERRPVFRLWVEARRKKEERSLLGYHFATGWRMLLLAAVIVGFGLGATIAVGHLSYHGNEPINLPKLLLWTIGVQWLVLLVATLFWFFRRALPDLRDFYPLQALLWGFELALRRLPGEQREAFRATVARLRHHREIYGSLMVWPMVIVTQLFAVAFNIGVLVAVLLLGQVQALRFGWQTTPDLSAEQAYRGVAAFAVPWQWAPNSHPTSAQVAASRFEPGQDLRELDIDATRAWWPFLMYSVLCYGLLVRLALLVFAAARLRGEIRHARFDHAEANALFRRLTGPLIQAEPTPASLEIPAESGAVARPRSAGAALALVSSDTDIDEAQLAEYLQRRYQWSLVTMQNFEIDRPRGNQALLERLRAGADDLAALPVIVRAKRPPIRAMALVLEEIRAATRKPELIILLLGRKEGATFSPVSDEELQHWKNFSAINGLHLGVEAWAP